MRRGFRNLLAAGAILTAGFAIHADTPGSESAAIQLQAADFFFSQGLFQASLESYRNALRSAEPGIVRAARVGLIQSALRVADFDIARREAETLFHAEPKQPDAMSLYGDTLWASGLFAEAETEYRDALAIEPGLARARHGMARSLAARSQLDAVMNEAQAALKLAPRDMEIHHTVGTIYERMHRYEQAADAYTNYVNLLPNKDTSEKAAWSRAEIRFLRSFGERTPFQTDPGAEDLLYTIDFKLVNEKVVIKAKINGSEEDFVVDTGSENTTVSRRLAQHVGINPVTYTLSAGVGEVGLRGLQLARIDTLQIGTLKLKNVPCIIKNPPLRDIPVREAETLSPVALGYSMIIDYKRHQITFGRHLPEEPVDFKLVNEKVIVRAKINGSEENFIVDTGSENTTITRRIAQRVGVQPVTYTLSAGVGEVGLRGLQLARIDTLQLGSLRLKNVPCIIKSPPLRDLPTREAETLSPVSLGYSMIIDYKRRQLTFGRHLPQEPSDFELPLRMHRLATVRGLVDRDHPTSFVVDTGGEVISISKTMAASLGREGSEHRIPLKVYGTSGWDRDAFLLPGVDLSFDKINYRNFPVVVLNLNAPSALLGFQLGGIVGHKFLSKYRVAIDLESSTLRLKESS